MTKKYDIIFINNESYMIDKEINKILSTEYYYHSNFWNKIEMGPVNNIQGHSKVLASTNKSLNLPLIPAVEELSSLALRYSKEDMRNCFLAAREFNSLDGVVDVDVVLNFKGADNSDLQALWTTPEEYLDSLKPRPIAVEVEVIPACEQLQTPECIRIDINNFVIVKKWIYENS